MTWKLLGLSLIFSQMLLVPAMGSGCNYKLLDLEADAINSRLSSHQTVSPDEIKESLRFIYDESRIDEQYKQPEKFRELYDLMITEVEGSFSRKFVEDCKSIFDADDSDLKTKSSVHLLLEKFREKYTRLIRLIRRHEQALEKENLEPEGSNTFTDKSDVFKMFFDKPQPRH